MTDQAKRDVRAFERWMAEVSHAWPDDLKTLGHLAWDALRTLDVPNPPEIAVRLAAKDLARFNEAYAAHASKGEPA